MLFAAPAGADERTAPVARSDGPRCTWPMPSPRPRGRSSHARPPRAGAGARRSARPRRTLVFRRTQGPLSEGYEPTDRGTRDEPGDDDRRDREESTHRQCGSEVRADPVTEARIRVPVVPVEERLGDDGEQSVDEDDIDGSAPAKLRQERRPRWPERRGARLHEHHHHEQGADADDRGFPNRRRVDGPNEWGRIWHGSSAC